VLFGEVRDAESGEALVGAVVRATWVLLNVAPAGARSRTPIVQEATLDLATDSTGTYWACKVPPSLEVTVRATQDAFTSGASDVVLGPRRIARRDLRVSREVIAAASPREARRPAADPAPRRGLATLAGVVRDTLGAARPGARVRVDGAAGLATTDSAGRFRLTGLPSGTQMVEARAIGYAPARITVELRNREVTDATIALTRGTVLAGVRVEETRRDRNRTEFEERRRLGAGYAVSGERIRNMPFLRTAFQAIPSIVVNTAGRSVIDFRIMMTGGIDGLCAPTIWIDGMIGSADMLGAILPTDVTGIEVYRRFASAPAKYQSGNARCGVVLVWTNFPS
jgi:hypothetical protein